MARSIEEVNGELADIAEEMARKWDEYMGVEHTFVASASGPGQMLGWIAEAAPRTTRLWAEKALLDPKRLQGSAIEEIASQLGWSDAIGSHALQSIGTEYEPECVLLTHSGREIRCPAYPQPCDYIRVVECGFELMYWNMDEVRESPEDVLGAIIGLAHGEVAAPTSIDLSQSVQVPGAPREGA